ncbi:hypothetical protein A7X12_13935 [Sphingomonas sp. TDK1]|nr:hypothetical protein A7X12_13935 [Sphingomonas sp. TDK1]
MLIGQIVVVFAIVIVGGRAATWAAAILAYQPELGLPWFRLGNVPIYHPWALFGWRYHYDAYAPTVFDKAGMLAGASGFLGCAAAIFGSPWRARQSSNVTTYGSARWASPREIERAGLHREAGVMLGTLGGRYLGHDGPEHIMAFAPTRSGKGVGLVVPTLLSWTGSTVVHDIKGENWTLTAGWRGRFSHSLLFNATDAASAYYNPLLEVRRGIEEVRDVQNIADILSDPQRSFVATLRRMMTTNHLGDDNNPRFHPVVASAARELLNKSENDVNAHLLSPPASPNMLSAGSVIAASLIIGLRSDLPGLVIPQGARLIGSYDSVVAFGQKRALVVHRDLILAPWRGIGG